MILQSFSVFDNKALTYSPPFHTHNDAAAVRMFSDVVNDSNTAIGRHPSDYALYNIGSFSDENGSLQPRLPLVHVIDAVALLRIAPSSDLFTQPTNAEILRNGKAL